MPPKSQPKARIADNGYRLCDPLPKGQSLIDTDKTRWLIGNTIGKGGFGEIYLCRREGDRQDGYVVKADNFDGPLFAEMNFYLRVAKEETIDAFVTKHRLPFLGMPRYVANGIHDTTSACSNVLNREVKFRSQQKPHRTGPTLQYRFLVMERFGPELSQSVAKHQLTAPDAALIAAKMIDVLHYIHTFGYIHADIKGANILRSITAKSKTSDYYLVDFGLADRYCDKARVHRDDKPDKKRANNGTVEYRSRDAHRGLISRRSDIECLSYNLIEWLYGRLPWMDSLSDANKVETKKEKAMADIDGFLRDCFQKSVPIGLKEFLHEVNGIAYNSEPNYVLLKKILTEKVSKNKTIVAKNVGKTDSDADDTSADDESDDEEPRRPKRSRKPTKRPTTKKSPQKRKNASKGSNGRLKKREIPVVDVSDDSDDNKASKSPPKRSRVAAIKSDYHLMTPKNGTKGRPLRTVSTPLLFAEDEDSFGEPVASAGDGSGSGRRKYRKSTIYYTLNGSLTDLSGTGDEAPTAPAETDAMKAVRIQMKTSKAPVVNSSAEIETDAMKAIRVLKQMKELEKQTKKKAIKK